MLIRIEGQYTGERILWGKSCSCKELRNKMKYVLSLEDRVENNSISLFCRCYGFEYLSPDCRIPEPDFVIDLDTYLVYRLKETDKRRINP